MLDQTKTPLLETLHHCVNRSHAAFYAPGHKRGQGISPQLKAVLGSQVFQADLPELPELDNLFAPEGVIRQAQELAAEAFGAAQTWFLVNGSTAGIIASILATCGSGDKIIVPRNVHQSVISGLVLAGAIAILITPEYDPVWDIAYSITPEAVSQALKQHPDAKAVMMVYPTYHGICGNIAAIADVTHQYNIPLLVDEAHGPHFAFHPDFPPSALAQGADLTVQSTHKVLGAMTQASMLHVQGNRINRDRLTQALQIVQSSSPSYLLLASLDAARQQMATEGKNLMTQTLKLAQQAKIGLEKIPGLSVLNVPQKVQPTHASGFVALDPTRLTVNLGNFGLSGYQADQILHQKLGVTAELPGLKHLTFIITFGNTEADINQMINAFISLKNFQLPQLTPCEYPSLIPSSPYALTSPRDAFFAPTHIGTISECIGYKSAEMICPYPPGIPVIMPGEIITREAIEYLHSIRDQGGTITGCCDSSLKTLKILSE